jgi:hypothetical protein
MPAPSAEAKDAVSTLSWSSTWIPLAIWAGFTILSALVLHVAGLHQPVRAEADRMPAGYWGVLTNWDGGWYRSIAEHGYPVPAPTVNGEIIPNGWAFLPLYPMLTRAVMAVTSLPFALSGWLLSLAFGAAAMLLVYRLVQPRLGRFGAGAVVASLCAYPSATLLQVTYSESLALLLVVAALLCIRERRYLVASFVALGLSLTRPIVLPLALVVLIHGLVRQRRESHAFSTRERCVVYGLALVTAVLVGLWPALADVVTGHRNTYLDSFEAWPANQLGDGVLGGWLPSVLALSPYGLIAILASATFVYLALRTDARLWGIELRAWGLVYPLYLFAVTRPTPSIFRYLMLSVVIVWPFPELLVKSVTGRRARAVRWIPLLAGHHPRWAASIADWRLSM